MDIDTLLALLDSKSNSISVPAPKMTTALILTGAPLKNGLSARKITSEIISDKSKLGIPVGPLPDGSQSIDEKMEYLRIERIILNILENARVTVAIPAGIPVTATGISAAGVPVTVQGSTTNIVSAFGIIQ